MTENLVETREDPFLLFEDAYGHDDGIKRELAHSKRFLERFTGDEAFAEAVRSDTLSLADAARECGCGIDVSTLRPVFDERVATERRTATLDTWRLTYLWDRHMQVKLKARNALLIAADSHGQTPAFDAWRARNINRASLQLGLSASGITHPPVTFELSDGCSVGCWFCGISAEKFKGHAEFGDGSEWRAIVRSVRSILGKGMRCGFCYWATDPLDNPEYVKYMTVFHEEVGTLPQTTSAIPLRNPELTRAVLRKRQECGGVVDRFSIMTTRKLIEVHQTFTPEELMAVELVLQMNNVKSTAKFKSGRTFREGKGKDVVAKYNATDGTIACVTGFLINIVKKTVKLISPTMPSEKWPDGYVIYDERTFTTGEDLLAVLHAIIDANMKMSLNPVTPLRLIEGGVFEKPDTLAVNSMVLKNDDFRLFEKQLCTGTRSALDILREATSKGIPPTQTVTALDRFWREGIINDHPVGAVATDVAA